MLTRSCPYTQASRTSWWSDFVCGGREEVGNDGRHTSHPRTPAEHRGGCTCQGAPAPKSEGMGGGAPAYIDKCGVTSTGCNHPRSGPNAHGQSQPFKHTRAPAYLQSHTPACTHTRTNQQTGTQTLKVHCTPRTHTHTHTDLPVPDFDVFISRGVVQLQDLEGVQVDEGVLGLEDTS
jgi:hypothetical protein